MKQSIYILALMLCVLFACKKGIEQDKLYIRGRLFLLDTITQYSNGIPLAGKKIYLSSLSDSSNFLYSVKTDAEGYFNFTLLMNKEDEFIISTNDTIKNYLYKSKMKVQRGNQSIVLIEKLDESLQNGFVLRTTDVAGSIIPKTTVSLYNSQALAMQDNSTGAIETFTTDSLGKCFKIQIPKGVYYINAKKIIDTATFQNTLFQITVPEKGFINDVIILNRKIITHQNGFNLLVQDSLGGFIPKANIYLYNSQVLATGNTINGVFDSFTTDNFGKYTRYDLPAGDYFINVTKVVSDTITYANLVNKITVPSTGMINVTIEVRRKR